MSRTATMAAIHTEIFAVRFACLAHVPSLQLALVRTGRYAVANPTPNNTTVMTTNHGRYGSKRVDAALSAPAPTSENTTGPMQQVDAATAVSHDPTTAFTRDSSQVARPLSTRPQLHA